MKVLRIQLGHRWSRFFLCFQLQLQAKEPGICITPSYFREASVRSTPWAAMGYKGETSPLKILN